MFHVEERRRRGINLRITREGGIFGERPRRQQIPQIFDNENVKEQALFPPTCFSAHPARKLFCWSAGNHSADVVDHDHRFKEFQSDQVAERDGLVADAFNFPGDFFSGVEAKLNFLTDLTLQNAGDRIPGLQGKSGIRKERSCGEKEQGYEWFHNGDN